MNQPGSVSDNVINSLLLDNSGVLWIGTESRGCNSLDLHRKLFKQLKVEDGPYSSEHSQQVTAITGNGSNTIGLVLLLTEF
ncbi:MAG: hypothetical protein HC906_11075 [Bacteroidales bacterium]|nr:hypothetical protein [Bacteroidales bacterium]